MWRQSSGRILRNATFRCHSLLRQFAQAVSSSMSPQSAVRWIWNFGEANSFHFNCAISACEKGREWALALGLLGEMSGAELVKDTVSYNAAISACEKGPASRHILRCLLFCPSSLRADVTSPSWKSPIQEYKNVVPVPSWSKPQIFFAVATGTNGLSRSCC